MAYVMNYLIVLSHLLATCSLTTGPMVAYPQLLGGMMWWVPNETIFITSGLQFCYRRSPPHPISESSVELWLMIRCIVMVFLFFRKDQLLSGFFTPRLIHQKQSLSSHLLISHDSKRSRSPYVQQLSYLKR